MWCVRQSFLLFAKTSGRRWTLLQQYSCSPAHARYIQWLLLLVLLFAFDRVPVLCVMMIILLVGHTHTHIFLYVCLYAYTWTARTYTHTHTAHKQQHTKLSWQSKEREHTEIKLVWNFYCVCSCESILWNWRQSFFETLSVVLCFTGNIAENAWNARFRHHPSTHETLQRACVL